MALAHPLLPAVAFASALLGGCATTSPVGDVAAPGPLDWKQQRYAEAIEGLTFHRSRIDVVPAETPGPAEPWIDLAGDREAAGDFVGAIAGYASALRREPDRASIYVALGRMLRIKGRADEARATFATARRLDPDLVEAHFEMALTQWHAGDSDAARRTMRTVITLEPTHGPAHSLLARWSYYDEDYAAAWRYTRAAQDLGQTLPPQFMTLLESKAPAGG